MVELSERDGSNRTTSVRALHDATLIRWSRSPNSRQLFGVNVAKRLDEERLALTRVALGFLSPTGSLKSSRGGVEQLLKQLKLAKHPGFI